MRKVIWRPKAVSRTALMLIAVLSGVGMLMVEHFKTDVRQSNYQLKIDAAQLAEDAMNRIYRERVKIGPEIDPEFDPSESGLIGVPMSSVTSVSGVLISKQTSVNPNFAAVVVDMLKRAGVQEGDTVAVGLSGSFPALNICTYAAIETLKLEPVVVSSCSASEWGANIPDFLWIDMEKILADEGYFSHRSDAATLGGFEDRGLGLSKEGLADIRRSIERCGLMELVASAKLEENIDKRMELITERAGPRPIKAYINVGGGSVSTGKAIGKKMFEEGLNLRPPGRIPPELDGVMVRYIQEGVPVIHLVQINRLAERYLSPDVIPPLKRPEVGQGRVYEAIDYNRWLAAGVLAVIVLALFGFIRSDIGFRLLQGGGGRKQSGYPEPMV